ncbi:hypothetical protein SARC_10645, partial [Sphaeroforma arctica JP610]
PALGYSSVAEEEKAEEAKTNANNLPSILQWMRKRSTVVDSYCRSNDVTELGYQVLREHTQEDPSFKDHPANQEYTVIDISSQRRRNKSLKNKNSDENSSSRDVEATRFSNSSASTSNYSVSTSNSSANT